MPIPEYKETGRWDGIKKAMKPTTKAEFFELVDELLEESGLSFSMIEAMDALGVCAASFINQFHSWIARLESTCSAYHVLPYPGGLVSQPVWMIEGFEVIRRARDDYYSWKMRRMRSKSKGK